ncbi:MAG: hypothetical protein PVG91_07095 [Gammaproteobacteria bacterium]|jgi:hypothetical protein
MSDVKLNVVAGTKNDQGWENVTASNGAHYAYKYTGGGDNNGNQTFVANQSPDVFDMVFKGQDGATYQFTAFNNKTTPSDLSGAVSSDGASIQITDACANVGTFTYGATVGVRKPDGSAPDVTFECDPVVRNVPGQI